MPRIRALSCSRYTSTGSRISSRDTMRSIMVRSRLLRLTFPSIFSVIQHAPYGVRNQSSSSSGPDNTTLDPRWLSDIKTRIGKCILFGISPAQTTETAAILKGIAMDWRELVAGSEGFLTDKEWRSVYRQDVAWGEMDSMGMPLMQTAAGGEKSKYATGHVNNVVYNRYAESARVKWALNLAKSDATHRAEWMELMTPKSIGLILRSIRTDYKFPMKWPDKVTVVHKLRNKPTEGMDHFVLDVLILSEAQRRAAARCVEDIVVYDYQQGCKAPLLPFMVERFGETFERQEQAREKNGRRIRALLEQVRRLEKGSWDRAEAQEDMGGA